jgi:hypothetical protein
MKKILEKIDKIYAGVILAIAVIVLMITGLEVLRVVGFHDNNFDYLPAENTLFAVEWVNDFTNDEVKNLYNLVGLANSKRILDADENMIPDELQGVLDLRSQVYKVYAIEKVQDKLVELFIYEVDDYERVKTAISELGWYSLYKGSRILITESEELADILSTDFVPVSQLERFNDSYSNIPKLSFSDVYLNHSLLEGLVLSEIPIMNYSKIVLNLFAVTTASINIESDGIYISTYTNPIDEDQITFPFTSKKYRAELLKKIPPDAEIVIGGVDLVSRLDVWLENLLGAKTPALIKNLLISNNLDIDTINLFRTIFSEEYLLAFYNEEPVLVLQSLGLEDQNLLIKQLQKLSANNNPKRISYQLEDGQIARQLVPDETTEYDDLGNGLYSFDIGINEEVYLFFADVTYITKSKDIIDRIKNNDSSFAETPAYENEYTRLMSVSDEVIYLSKEKVSELSGLYLEDAPSITSSFNYFDDGIQTVHYLTW